MNFFGGWGEGGAPVPGGDGNRPSPGFARVLVPLSMPAALTLTTRAEYPFRTEVNPDGSVTVNRGDSGPSGKLNIPNIIQGRKVTCIRRLVIPPFS